MTRSAQTNWNKNAKMYTRGVGAATGLIASSGNPQAAAFGYQIGSMADPVINYLLPAFDSQSLVKHNISSGTIADNYQYGKTDDAYSLVMDEYKDPLAKFEKGLNIADTAVGIYSSVGGITGGLGGTMDITSGAKATQDMATASSVGADGLSVDMLSQKTTTPTFDFNNKTIEQITQHNNQIVPEKKKMNISDWWSKIDDKIYNKQKENDNQSNDAWNEMVDKDIEQETFFNTSEQIPEFYDNNANETVGYTNDTTKNLFKNIQSYFRRKKNVPSF